MAEGPLSGIIVIDLTRVLAGPYCTMVLSDLGARVIKVEPPLKGDDSRGIGPFVRVPAAAAAEGGYNDNHGKSNAGSDGGPASTEPASPPDTADTEDMSAYFMSLNRAKESIALDLKAAGDRAIFERLLAHADVLVENYRPGAMARLGYGWQDLRERFPRLIYAAASGFGQTGPYAARPAYDMVVQGMGGIMSITGQPDGPPTRVGTSIGDITAGLFTAIGINTALYHRRASGAGMMVDVAMLDSQVAILENALARYQATGIAPGPIGARHPSITPFEALATADGHVIVAAGNEGLFDTLCDAIGLGELKSDPRYADNHARTQNHDSLKPALEAALVAHPTAHWLKVLGAAGVPSGPINDIPALLADPQVRARNMIVPIAGDGENGEDAAAGAGAGGTDGAAPLAVAGNPIKLSSFADPPSRRPARPLDADRAAILAWLDASEADAAAER